MDTLRSMRRVFGSELRPDPSLVEWAREERRKETRAKSYATYHDAKLAILPSVAPVLAKAMESRTYQKSGAAFSRVAGNVCIADEPGLGKTALSLAGIAESGRWNGMHLICSPKTAIFSTWVRQIQAWTGAEVFGMPEGKAARSKVIAAFLASPSKSKFLVVNPAMLRRSYGKLCKKCNIWAEDVKANKESFIQPEHHTERGHTPVRMVRKQDWPELFEVPWSSITIDESHEIFAQYTPANVTQATQGLLDIRKDAKLTALTGTPLRGQERNIWGTLDWLGVNTGGYWSFVSRYMEVAEGHFGITVYGLDPAEKEDFYKLIDRYVLRRTRAEARPDLPMGQRVDITLPLEGKHRRQYKEFELEGETFLKKGILSGQGLLSELTRLKQLSYGEWSWEKEKLLPSPGASPVLEWLIQFLQDRGVTGKASTSWIPEEGTAFKYVVASQFTEILDSIERDLAKRGIKTLKITGSVTGYHRRDAVAKFQSTNQQERVMLIQTQTGGVSIDLDAWCDEMVILDETWVADDQVQLEGRINNRSGRVSPRMWYYVRVEDTVQMKVAEGNYSQHNMQHSLLDGRRGVKLALHLLSEKR